jgi:thiosulfate/3-mercaptopyruvate sulfurtransferase
MLTSKAFLGLFFSICLSLFVTLIFIPVFSGELPSKVISTEWLEANLSKENLRIIDIRSSLKDYWQGHIPGAVYLSLDALRWPDGGVPVKLLPAEALAMMLGEMGVNEKDMVVVYSEKPDYKAPYLIWALDYIGHHSSALLEGGFDKWQEEERPTTKDYPDISLGDYKLASKLDEEVRASLEEVRKIASLGGGVIVDVRPAELYTGEKGFWKRKGHIKGSINRLWTEDLKEDGTWKPKEDLKKAYTKLGATPDKTIIVSCGQGLMAAHTYFTLKYILGYPQVKNYDGSFSEWSNIDELPVETVLK